MKKLLFLVSAVFLFAFDWSGKVNWGMSYDMAKNVAKKEHKLVMVDVALTHCPPCRYLASKVYTNSDVANYINKNFVPLMYLADEDKIPLDVANYFTGSTPTLLFIKPNGELCYRHIGALPPKAFKNMLEQVKANCKVN